MGTAKQYGDRIKDRRKRRRKSFSNRKIETTREIARKEDETSALRVKEKTKKKDVKV